MTDHPPPWTSKGITCRELAERASQYYEDQLSIFNKFFVGLHLLSCPHCRAYVKQIDLVASSLEGLPKFSPSAVNRLRLRQQFAAHYGQ